MTELGHVHEWGPKSYVDYCHYVQIEKTCKGCDVVNIAASERNFDLNPLQIAYAREDCAECRQLAKGYEPASWRAPTSTEGGTRAEPSG